jgi:hypothetical protein
MPEIPAKPIESSATDHVELPPFGIGHELIEGRPTILRPTDTLVNRLDCRPVAGLDITAKFLKLVLGILIERAHNAKSM